MAKVADMLISLHVPYECQHHSVKLSHSQLSPHLAGYYITSVEDTAALTLSLPMNHLNQRGKICHAYQDPIWLILAG